MSKSGHPVVKTPGNIDILVNSKSPVSTGAKIPGCSQSKEGVIDVLERLAYLVSLLLLKLLSPSSNQRLVVEHLPHVAGLRHQSPILCHNVEVALTSSLYPSSQTV